VGVGVLGVGSRLGVRLVIGHWSLVIWSQPICLLGLFVGQLTSDQWRMNDERCQIMSDDQ
jgi:hypothetical protein